MKIKSSRVAWSRSFIDHHVSWTRWDRLGRRLRLGQEAQLVVPLSIPDTDVFNMPSWDTSLCQSFNVQLHDAHLVNRPFYLWRFSALAPRAPCVPSGKTLVSAARYPWTNELLQSLNMRNSVLFPGEAPDSYIPFKPLCKLINPLPLVISVGSFRDLPAPWASNSPFFPFSLVLSLY